MAYLVLWELNVVLARFSFGFDSISVESTRL